jgi:hypothetical protein
MAETSGFHNIVGLTRYIDTHLVDAPDETVGRLRRLRQEGWISLQRTDTMDIELADAPAARLPRLMEASAAYPEPLGPVVSGHSRWDFSVWGSQEDSERLDEVFAILFPAVNRATCRRNHVRDAMHIATSIRYGGYGFITREKRLLNKAARIAERFQGFRLWSPEQALAEAAGRIRDRRVLHERDPGRGPLSTWLTAGELSGSNAQ